MTEVKERKSEIFQQLLAGAPDNFIISDSLERAQIIISSPKYRKIICSVSGGVIQI